MGNCEISDKKAEIFLFYNIAKKIVGSPCNFFCNQAKCVKKINNFMHRKLTKLELFIVFGRKYTFLWSEAIKTDYIYKDMIICPH